MEVSSSGPVIARQVLGLDEPHARFRDLAESLPTLVWTCRGDGPCDYLSPQWVAYTGIPEHEQLGYGWLDQVHPDDRERVIEEWTERSLAGGVFDISFRIRRHDGVYRWFKTRAVPFVHEQGRIAKWFGSNTDVQDIRDAQEQLAMAARELEDRVQQRTAELERVAERLRETATRLEMGERIAHLGTWELEVGSGLVRWSDELFAIMHLPVAPSAPSYQAQASIFLPDSWQRIQQVVSCAITEGEPYEVDVDMVRPDGSIRHCIARGEPRRDAQGVVTRLVGTLQDVTELVQERRQRDLVAERMRLATQAAGFGFWEWSVPDDRVTWDQRRTELAGLPGDAAPMTRAAWLSTIVADDRARVAAALEAAVHGTGRYEVEYRHVLPGGDVRYMQDVATVRGNAAGRVTSLVGVARDVTAKRRNEQALRRQAAELKRSNRDLEQFAYAASHDLQEPLRAVAGCAQLLQKRYAGRLDAPADELLVHIVDGAARMGALVEDLLAYSRVGTRTQLLVPVSAREALALALSNLAAAIGESGAVIEAGALPVVRGDETQLVMLFQNLVGNAIKYRNAESPRISITAEAQGEVWEFAVRDNGIGIEPAYVERIFELFQRLHTREEYPGTGIGLAICRRIVDRHSGRIWVESAPGHGSIFRFTLPRTESAA